MLPAKPAGRAKCSHSPRTGASRIHKVPAGSGLCMFCAHAIAGRAGSYDEQTKAL